MKRMGSPVSGLILLMCNLTILFVFHISWGDTRSVMQYVVEGMLLISILISVIVLIRSLGSGDAADDKVDPGKDEEDKDE